MYCNLEYQQEIVHFGRRGLRPVDQLVAETAVRSYVRLEKFFEFVFLSVSVGCDRDRRNYLICFKFGLSDYAVCEISCLVFCVHCPNIMCIGIQKSISMHYLWKNIVSAIVRIMKLAFLTYSKTCN